MATRSIITHQPEVSCDLCGRRLLRGERPDVFLDAGDTRTVCELCAPRAAGEGWLRASEAPAARGVTSARPRRGRSLLDRLRQRREPGTPAAVFSAAREGDAAARRRRRRSAWEHDLDDAWEPEHAVAKRTEAAEAEDEGPAVLLGERPQQPHAREPAADGEPVAGRRLAEEQASVVIDDAQADARSGVALAVETFNASECAARISGISRALGDPSVTVRAAGEDRVSVVVAWELCWYRYEVDLSVTPATIALTADGSELDELEEADRAPNAAADERGELALLR